MAPDHLLQRPRQDGPAILRERHEGSVRGRIHYTKWKDQQGNDRYGCEIIAETVDFLSRAKQTENNDGKQPDYDDEIPF